MKPLISIPIYKSSKIKQLSKINHTIYGFDLDEHLFSEIDIKHSIVYHHHFHNTQSGKLLNAGLIDKHYFNENQINQGFSDYFCVYQKSIEKYNFLSNNLLGQSVPENSKRKSTLLTTNSLADFTGVFDAFQRDFVFVKHHLNHDKYTINWLHASKSEKKILKLLDVEPLDLKLVRNYPQVIYSDTQGQIKYFSIQKPEYETLITKRATILFDNWTLYTTKTDLVSKFNGKYDIEALDLKSGKLVFSFQGQNFPIKIQCYKQKIFYLSEKGLYIYDKRKLQTIDFVQIQEKKGGKNQWRPDIKINDFLLDTNLNKIYLSVSNQLRVYEYDFNKKA